MTVPQTQHLRKKEGQHEALVFLCATFFGACCEPEDSNVQQTSVKVVHKCLQQGSLYHGSDYNTCHVITLPLFRKSNLGQLPLGVESTESGLR